MHHRGWWYGTAIAAGAVAIALAAPKVQPNAALHSAIKERPAEAPRHMHAAEDHWDSGRGHNSLGQWAQAEQAVVAIRAHHAHTKWAAAMGQVQ